MEQTYEVLTQNLKSENETSKLDIEGTVIKLELNPSLTQYQKQPNVGFKNVNQEEHIVEIKTENQANDQNAESQNALAIE